MSNKNWNRRIQRARKASYTGAFRPFGLPGFLLSHGKNTTFQLSADHTWVSLAAAAVFWAITSTSG